MVRIRGRIGDWPVDLTVEMDAEDWAQLAQHVAVTPTAGAVAPAPTADAGDALWQTALQLVRDAGQVEGPKLMAQLAALAGGEAAGKRLLGGAQVLVAGAECLGALGQFLAGLLPGAVGGQQHAVGQPEAPGIEQLLAGLRASESDDDALLVRACEVFDWLLKSYEEKTT